MTLGGAPPRAEIDKALRCLESAGVDAFDTALLVAPEESLFAEPGRDLVRRFGGKLQVASDVQDMSTVMSATDVALAAAGGTAWELAFMRVPMVLLVTAENQRAVAESLHRAGAAFAFGNYEEAAVEAVGRQLCALLESPSLRAQASRAGRALVDGLGVERVLMALRAEAIVLRRAEKADSHQLWEWANDPSVRAVSFSTQSISWQEHERWYAAQLEDPNSVLYLATAAGSPFGVARYVLKGDRAEMSVSIDARMRGRGLGSTLIEEACSMLLGGTNVVGIDALVREDNQASRRAFLKARFVERGRVQVRGIAAVHLVRAGVEPRD
jgi:RimJ/RimL family protein N-acetyltransferase